MPQMTFEQLCELFGYIPKNRPLWSNEVAELLGVHPVTVDQWRVRGDGPRYFNPTGTRRVWYAEKDILAWMAAGEKRSTSENETYIAPRKPGEAPRPWESAA